MRSKTCLSPFLPITNATNLLAPFSMIKFAVVEEEIVSKQTCGLNPYRLAPFVQRMFGRSELFR